MRKKSVKIPPTPPHSCCKTKQVYIKAGVSTNLPEAKRSIKKIFIENVERWGSRAGHIRSQNGRRARAQRERERERESESERERERARASEREKAS